MSAAVHTIPVILFYAFDVQVTRPPPSLPPSRSRSQNNRRLLSNALHSICSFCLCNVVVPNVLVGILFTISHSCKLAHNARIVLWIMCSCTICAAQWAYRLNSNETLLSTDDCPSWARTIVYSCRLIVVLSDECWQAAISWIVAFIRWIGRKYWIMPCLLCSTYHFLFRSSVCQDALEKETAAYWPWAIASTMLIDHNSVFSQVIALLHNAIVSARLCRIGAVLQTISNPEIAFGRWMWELVADTNLAGLHSNLETIDIQLCIFTNWSQIRQINVYGP